LLDFRDLFFDEFLAVHCHNRHVNSFLIDD
jgi:hypothetical protein